MAKVGAPAHADLVVHWGSLPAPGVCVWLAGILVIDEASWLALDVGGRRAVIAALRGRVGASGLERWGRGRPSRLQLASALLAAVSDATWEALVMG